MGAAADLWIEVHGSPGRTIVLGAFFFGCAIALYLSASAFAGTLGPLAGGMASLAGVTWLAWCMRCQARCGPRWLRLGEEGWVEWCDRAGKPGTGQVVAAVRVGGLWVSLSVQLLSEQSGGGQSLHGQSGRRLRKWLLPADALDPEDFRALAVRVPHTPRSRP